MNLKPYFIAIFLFVLVFTSCQDLIALPNGKLTSEKWACLNNLQNQYNALVYLKFTDENGIGSIEAWEEENVLPSCLCNGNYKLSEDRKTLIISGIYNSNCPWMEKLNGNYTFTNVGKMLKFQNGSITIGTPR